MSWAPARRSAVARLASIVRDARADLKLPGLRWFVSQQPPTSAEGLDAIDVVAEMRALAAADELLFHVEAFDLPPQPKELVLDTAGVVELGRRLAARWAEAN